MQTLCVCFLRILMQVLVLLPWLQGAVLRPQGDPLHSAAFGLLQLHTLICVAQYLKKQKRKYRYKCGVSPILLTPPERREGYAALLVTDSDRCLLLLGRVPCPSAWAVTCRDQGLSVDLCLKHVEVMTARLNKENSGDMLMRPCAPY